MVIDRAARLILVVLATALITLPSAATYAEEKSWDDRECQWDGDRGGRVACAKIQSTKAEVRCLIAEGKREVRQGIREATLELRSSKHELRREVRQAARELRHELRALAHELKASIRAWVHGFRDTMAELRTFD